MGLSHELDWTPPDFRLPFGCPKPQTGAPETETHPKAFFVSCARILPVLSETRQGKAEDQIRRAFDSLVIGSVDPWMFDHRRTLSA